DGNRVILSDETGKVQEGPVELEGRGNLALSPDGKTLAVWYGMTNFFEGGVRLYDVPSRRPIGESLRMRDYSVSGVTFSPDSKALAVEYRAGPLTDGVILYDVRRPYRLVEKLVVDGHRADDAIAFSPDGNLLAFGFCDSFIGPFGNLDTNGFVLYD